MLSPIEIASFSNFSAAGTFLEANNWVLLKLTKEKNGPLLVRIKDKSIFVSEGIEGKYAFVKGVATYQSLPFQETTESISENESCKRISISKENYQKLAVFINDSFQRDSNKNLQCISGRGYAKNDCFYEAKGSYSLFRTCNTWANDALNDANQKAAFWTPYDGGIFCHYQ